MTYNVFGGTLNLAQSITACCTCTQTAARLTTLRQTHKLLGMELLSNKELFSRSRPRTDDSAAAGTDAGATEAGNKENGETDAAAGGCMSCS